MRFDRVADWPNRLQVRKNCRKILAGPLAETQPWHDGITGGVNLRGTVLHIGLILAELLDELLLAPLADPGVRVRGDVGADDSRVGSFEFPAAAEHGLGIQVGAVVRGMTTSAPGQPG